VSDELTALLDRMCADNPLERPTLLTVVSQFRQLGLLD
jgi:hypothetical protein